MELREPIEKLVFRNLRSTDLTNIADKLSSTDVKDILLTLRKANSKYAKPVESLSCLVEKTLKNWPTP